MDKKMESITLSVHRCRFVDYTPSAITALAYPPLRLPSIKGKKSTATGKKFFRFGLLAVGHANGNIDICEWAGGAGAVQCSQAWVVRKILSGPYPSKVDSLTFVLRHPDDLSQEDVPNQSQLRLFSSGGGTELLEWDLDRGCIRRTISSQGGSIWSIAANPSCTSLALGCEDGTVRILSVANDTLTHSRRFDRVKCRILSIAWGPPVPRPIGKTPSPSARGGREDSDSDEDEDDWTDSWLVTGGSDTSLRKWDVGSGRVLDRMGVGKLRGERTLVWTVVVLGDGTVVSGDSLGMVKFWDSKTCTQLYSFKAHGADVLCMTIGPDGRTLYTSGVDQKTVQFSLIKIANTSTPQSTAPTTQWTQTASKRMHSHDVRALAIWPPYTPLPASYQRRFPLNIAPVLASGGLDMSIVLTSAAPAKNTIVKVTNPLNTSLEATFEDSYHRKVGYIAPGRVQVARGARLVSCVRDAGLSVWRILKKGGSSEIIDNAEQEVDLDAVDDETQGGWERVLEMELNVHSNIIGHEISDDGKWLAVSDLYETKLFSLHPNENGKIGIKRVKDFASILQPYIPGSSNHPASTGSSCIRFTPDSSKLVLATALSSFILVIDLTDEQPKVLRRFDHHRTQDLCASGRVIRGKLASNERDHGQRKVNGHALNGDVEMTEPVSPSPSAQQNGIGSSDNSEDEDGNTSSDADAVVAIVNISRIALSADGQWLATSDNCARLHIFNLDSITHHTTLPTFSKPAQCLSFDPMHPSVLLLAFPDNTIQIYDVETRQFPIWGKDLAYSLPRKVTSAHEVILGVEFDPFEPGESQDGKTRYVLFWGSTWIFKASLDTITFVRSGRRKKRRREEEKASANEEEEERQWRDCKMITQYRPILCCDFLSKNELVIVERPLVDVLMTLPPAYFKHKYGNS